MIKKIGIILISLIATFSVVYTVNQNINATSTKVYYEPGEAFIPTGLTYFKMGGYNWYIIYTDQSTGRGYIATDQTASNICGMMQGYYQTKTFTASCLGTQQTSYKVNSMDAIGKSIYNNSNNEVETLKYPSVEDYNIFTQNETTSFVNNQSYLYKTIGPFVLSDMGSIEGVNEEVHVGYEAGTTALKEAYTLLSGYTNIGLPIFNKNAFPMNRPFFEVEIPEKALFIEHTPTNTGVIYEGSTQVAAGATMGSLKVSGISGPYAITMESGVTSGDVDENGNSLPDGTMLSDDFEVSVTSATTGTATIKVKSGVTLAVGDYYVKVHGEDTSQGGIDSMSRSIVIKYTIAKEVKPDTLEWTPVKDIFSAEDVISGKVVGSLLGSGGTPPYTYALSSSSNVGYDLAAAADNSSFSIVSGSGVAAGTSVNVKTRTSLPEKTYYVQFKITDKKGKYMLKNVTIDVKKASQANLLFKDKAGGTEITTTGKSVMLSDKTQKLVAEGGSTTNAIEYEVAPVDMQTDANAINIVTIGKSDGSITPKQVGKVKVQAKRPGGTSYEDVVAYMDLEITAAEQEVTFNNTKDTIYLKKDASQIVDAKGTVKGSSENGHGDLTYTSSNINVATVNPTTGEVMALSAGTTSITAILNDSKGSNYDVNYNTASTTKNIEVYGGMEIRWNKASTNIKAGNNAVGDTVGTLIITNNKSTLTYAKSSNTAEANKAASFFQIQGSGASATLKLLKTISASDWATYGGSFNVQIDVTDTGTGEVKTQDITIVVDEADNDAYFVDENNVKVSTDGLKKKYGDAPFTLKVHKSSSNSSETYSLDDGASTEILNVTGDGQVTIKKIGETTVKAIIGAADGYAEKVITMKVVVEPADQTLTWIGTNILKSGNSVVKKEGTTNTWEISLRYSGSEMDVIAIDELVNTESGTSGNLGIKSNISESLQKMNYTIAYENVNDSNMVKLGTSTDNANKKTIEILGAAAGTVTIEAQSDAVGNYGASEKYYLEIHVTDSLTLNYTPSYETNISTISNYAKANTKIGSFAISPSTETGFVYSITEITSNNIPLTGTYTIDSNNGDLKVGANNLSVGTYSVSVKATKSETEFVSKTITIEVVKGDYDTSTWKWQKQVDSTYTNIDGSIGNDFIYTNPLVDTFEKNKVINVKLNGVDSSANVTYSLVDDNAEEVITLNNETGYAKITILKASPTQSSVKIKANIVDSKGNYNDKNIFIPVQINKYPQKIKFEDASPLYLSNASGCREVKTMVESDLSNLSETNLIELSSTSSAFTIEGNKICPVANQTASNITLKANLQGDSDFENAPQVTKTIHIYNPGNITISESISVLEGKASNVTYTKGTLIKALSDSVTNPTGTAKKDTKVANVKLNDIAVAQTNPYALSTNSGDENKDKAYFSVEASTGNIKLNQDVRASDLHMRGDGFYNIQVDVQDIYGFIQTVDVTIQIGEAENDAYFTDADGNKITGTLSKVYGEDKNSFQLTTHTSNNSTNITYALKNPDDSVLEVLGNGKVNIKNTGTTTITATVASGSGYDGKTIEMPIEVTEGTQSVTFKNTTRTKYKFEANGTFIEDADLIETSGNGLSTRTITYSSNSESICTIDQTGEVTMLATGICKITAKNIDANWKIATTSKQITLYDKKVLNFEPVEPILKANANAINDIVGTIHVSENQGPIQYSKSTSTDAENGEQAFFSINPNGASADLVLAKEITASDWASHNGLFHVMIEVSDDNGSETLNVTVELDKALNTVSFTRNGVEITSLSKQFGEDINNEFKLTSTSSSTGVATYSIDSSDTSDTLSVLDDGSVTIHKVGTATVHVSVPEGNGYAAGSATMPITISKGQQAIAFNNPKNTNHEFVLNDGFQEPATLTETSKQAKSSRSITYDSSTKSICTIDSGGNVVMLATGTCKISASNTDENWEIIKPATKEIVLYDGLSPTFLQNKTPQAATSSAQANALVGSVNVVGGMDPITYGVSTNTGEDNKDATFFQVNPETGAVSLKKAITASDIANSYDKTLNAYVMNVIFTVTDGANNTVSTESQQILIKGAPLSNVAIDTNGTGKITKTYVEVDGSFSVNLLNNTGKGRASYRLKNNEGMPQDVISISNEGIVSILNANEVGKDPVYIEAEILASGGYDATTVECEVEIKKAEQAFKFKTTNKDLSLKASMDLLVEGIQAKDSEGNLLDWRLTKSDAPTLLSVNKHTVKSLGGEGKVMVTALVNGDRNYNSKNATMTINITSKPAYTFEIMVPQVTYGDVYDESDPLKAMIIADEGVGTKTQIWSISDETVASINEVGNIIVHNAGEATITCTQSIVGQPDVSSEAQLLVLKKPIQVKINNKEKYVGEAMPSFDAVLPIEDLVGNDTLEEPNFQCRDGASIVTANTKAGSYQITGNYGAADYPNYKITIQNATLTVKQDTSQPAWYHLEGATSASKLDGTKWVNENVKVLLDNADASAGTYDEISLNKSAWGTSQIIDKEGVITTDVNFRIKNSGSIATSQSISVKIDKTKPVIKSITGTKVNDSGVAKFVNAVSFGAFFKPGVEVEMIADDSHADATITTSGIASISYQAYVKENDRFVEIDKGNVALKGTKGKVILADPGVYRVCATTRDNAGNVSNEYCSELNVKKIDVDSDGDGKPDFNDPDGDGCPDLNIVLQDKNARSYKLNVNLDNDNIPDLNIDSNGDGKADINIDLDNDKKADLNIVKLTSWKPTVCVTGQSSEYCTDERPVANINVDLDGDQRPDINVDLDGNGIPDIDIDTDGDGKPDINIDVDQDGTPDKKIKVMKDWIIDKKVFEVDGVKFQTMTGLTEDKIDQLEDGGLIAKPGNGTVFLPNFAIKVTDKTDSIDASLKEELSKVVPDKIIKRYLEVDLVKDNIKIQPDGTISISVPVDATIKNPTLLIEQEDGNFVEVEGTYENGLFTFETSYVGKIIILGDDEASTEDPIPTPDPDPDPNPKPNPDPDTDKDTDTNVKPEPVPDPEDPSDSSNSSDDKNSSTSVKGTYTSNVGGALTGDTTNIMVLTVLLSSTLLCLIFSYKKAKK